MLPSPDVLVPFIAASILIIAIPGADTALVTRQVLVGGTSTAQRTIFGNSAGVVVHGLALAIGLSALLVASATAYTTVKLAGAAYLIWLGIQALRAAQRPAQPTSLTAGITAPRRAFLAGLISTVLNPKPALFFLTFLPQFVDRGGPVFAQTMTLAAIHVLLTFAWLSIVARMVNRARTTLAAPRVKAWLERTTGAVLIALGVRVAVEKR